MLGNYTFSSFDKSFLFVLFLQKERAVVDDMEVASADHTTIAGAPIPHSQSLPQSTFSLAASSSSHQAGKGIAAC